MLDKIGVWRWHRSVCGWLLEIMRDAVGSAGVVSELLFSSVVHDDDSRGLGCVPTRSP